mgnify:CR=1 FL=1
MPITKAKLMDKNEKLLERAREAKERAYCRYSSFPVGAAILFEDGSVVEGCNVENASFSLTICAERVAMTRAIAEGKSRPVAVAVTGKTPGPLTPCGACRQFLAEFNLEMEVVSQGTSGEIAVYKLSDLLPAAFVPEDLDKKDS